MNKSNPNNDEYICDHNMIDEGSDVATILENGLLSIKSEVIRVYHGYNPNYKNEIRDYELRLGALKKELDLVSYPNQNEVRRKQIFQEIKTLEKSKPKQKEHCGPFHPSRFPLEIIESLRDRRKLRTIDHF